MTPHLVVALAVHPPSVAATRLRALQYAPYLAEEGLLLELRSFLRESDLAAWYGPSQAARAVVVLKALLRLPMTVRRLRQASLVLVQREALPLGPPWLERWAARRAPLVWDVDDAIWVDFTSPTAGRVPRWVRATGDKYAVLCARADQVWAGSAVLADWCQQHQGRVDVVPTVVPVPPRLPDASGATAICWIGSHSTGPFIADMLPALEEVVRGHRVQVLGARPAAPAAMDLDVGVWSEAAEQEVLRAARVGLYPIDRKHPLAEGKCGLKAVLYMAHGVPPVVTPTTTNAVVVRDGTDGLHADTPEKWAAQVQRILSEDDLWASLRVNGHQRALEEYSLQAWGPRVARRLRALAVG